MPIFLAGRVLSPKFWSHDFEKVLFQSGLSQDRKIPEREIGAGRCELSIVRNVFCSASKQIRQSLTLQGFQLAPRSVLQPPHFPVIAEYSRTNDTMKREIPDFRKIQVSTLRCSSSISPFHPGGGRK